TVEAEEIFFSNVVDMVARPFRHEANTRQLSFEVHLDPNLGRSITTDSKRLQQVLKNLLSNAFKFTEQGGVRLSVSAALGGWSGAPPSIAAVTHLVPDRPLEQIPDDRREIQPGDPILLIVEDDPHYARIVMDLARDKGFKTLLAMRGDDALDLAKQYQPTAVSLDVFLPDMLGWNVLSQLKKNPLTRHIPVQ